MYRNYPDSNRLVVANRAQKMLFLHEIQGQLSDGHWENASPHDHWEVWCELQDHQVLINADGSKLGRNFYPRREKYGLASKSLLDVVGGRMIVMCRLATAFDFDVADELTMKLFGWMSEGCPFTGPSLADNKHGAEERAFAAKFDLAEVKRIGEDSTLYDMKQLKSDLRQLAFAMRTYQAIK